MPNSIPVSVTVSIQRGKPGDWLFAAHQLRAAKADILSAVARRFVEITRTNFGPVDRGFRPTAWPPLSKRYRERNLKRPGYQIGYIVPTLFRSGLLFSTLRSYSAGNQAVAEADTPYAAAHQFGSTKRHIPARPYFPVTGSGGNLQLYGPAKAELDQVAHAQAVRSLNRMGVGAR